LISLKEQNSEINVKDIRRMSSRKFKINLNGEELSKEF
jgi:hypothetical protein